MTSSYLVSAARTPIGKFLGGLSTLPAADLGAVAIKAALERAAWPPANVDEVIMGNVLSAGQGQAPARQAALGAGLPETVAAVTVNKVCGSGLKAVMLADQAIRAGDARAIVAGGMESMSRAPYLLAGSREGWKFGDQKVVDSMIHDGLWCAFEDSHMGVSADYIADKCEVSRADQDEFAASSHQKATAAVAAGKFAAELAAVTVPGRKGDTLVEADEGPRPDSSAKSLARLRPAFSGEGSVTAGNASQLSDGAAAVLVVDEATAHEVDSPVKARIVATATSGVAPKDIFIAPVSAMEKVLAKAELSVADIDLFELNEAFAAQSLACLRALGIDAEKTNVHGGAIALGHPIGASGARVLVTLLYALADRGLQRGLASLCLGGGNAVAIVVERA
ncbi:MAG: acetyl-CoA C-acetyltransferase [Planctomycetota bacterium]|nr:MAG: acetyl-CoA C-acetyltransferase [Planctomycetota bacterium]REJ94841.1 MAG: acetyl-CoA C-acetyltransferase [Planctomycetota bacterium]REK25510.1 MAG: acetyl-CoA C-acetyltransferase [Planctomycetota bacterium]REK45944.1 MAG: acetyl-CoA C-acetyltransferase [Planctomycetota bacterium]